MLKRLARGLALGILFAGSPNPVWAQEVGWFVSPSFGLTEEFDDNVLRASSRERADLVSRFSPGVTAGYKSETLTLLGGYTFDAEVYANNSELNDEARRQRAEFNFHHLPTRLLTLDLRADYAETETPTELEEETGIEIGRRRATGIRVRPSVSYRFDPLTSGDAKYLFARRSVERSQRTSTRDTTLQRGELGFTRQLTPLDSGLLGYRISVFESEESDATSHTPTIGWARSLTKNTVLTVRGGPRLTEGEVDREVSAQVEHQFRQAKVSVEYARTEGSRIVDRTGLVDLERASALLHFQPLRFLEVELKPSVRNTFREQERATTVYELGAAATYQLTRWLSARAEYRFRLQERRPEEILQNVFSIGLHATYPIRIY